MNIISQLIVYVMVAAMLIAAFDRIIGNKLGLGDCFENGFNALGELVLGMAGVMVSSKLIGKVITNTVGKLFSLIGVNISMASSLIVPIDMGAYTLAHSLEPNNPDIANFSSIFLASTLATTIAFSIPVALGIIKKEDQKYLAIGSLAGIIAVPFACLIGGSLAGYKLSMMLINLVPLVVFSSIIAIGLYFFTDITLKVFLKFSKGIVAYATFFLALAIFQELTPIQIVELLPLSEVFITCGNIAIMLAGAFPLVKLITKYGNKPLSKIGTLLGINETSVAGLIANLANCIPAYGLLKDMDEKGKILNVAFSVCAAFALGDDLGFVAGVEPQLIAPMVIAKISGGIIAIFIAIFIYNKKFAQTKTSE